ncbi:hypothetical protein ABK040_015869 [Willaertia magna]
MSSLLMSTLHNDILFQILFYLTPFEISKLQLINKYWNLNCKDNILWKYFYNYYFKQFESKDSIFSNVDYNEDYNEIYNDDYNDDYNSSKTEENNDYNNDTEINDNTQKDYNNFYWYNKFIYFVKFIPKYLPIKSQEIFTKFKQEKKLSIDDEEFTKIYIFKIFNNFTPNIDTLQNAIKLMKLSLFFSILMFDSDYKINILNDFINLFGYYNCDLLNLENLNKNLNKNLNNELKIILNEFGNYENVVKIVKKLPILSFCKLYLDYNYKDIFYFIYQSFVMDNLFTTTNDQLNNQLNQLQKLQQQEKLYNKLDLNNPYNENDYFGNLGISPNIKNFNDTIVDNNDVECDVFCKIDSKVDWNGKDLKKDNNNNYHVTYSDLNDFEDYNNGWCPIYFNAGTFYRGVRFEIDFNVDEGEVMVKISNYTSYC